MKNIHDNLLTPRSDGIMIAITKIHLEKFLTVARLASKYPMAAGGYSRVLQGSKVCWMNNT